MTNPRLGVILLTYDRMQYARVALDALARHMVWRGELRIHIADDGSPGDYRGELIAQAIHLWPDACVTVTNTERRGYGASYNAATQVIHDLVDYILPLEDDWECLRSFRADRYAGVLAAPGGAVGCVRLGYLGYTQPLRGEVRYIADVPLLLFDPDSPEPHVSAGHPRLEARGWARGVGPWTEGLNPGATEFDWCQRRVARQHVAWPMDIRVPGDLFAHIGAVQAREDQR